MAVAAKAVDHGDEETLGVLKHFKDIWSTTFGDTPISPICRSPTKVLLNPNHDVPPSTSAWRLPSVLGGVSSPCTTMPVNLDTGSNLQGIEGMFIGPFLQIAEVELSECSAAVKLREKSKSTGLNRPDHQQVVNSLIHEFQLVFCGLLEMQIIHCRVHTTYLISAVYGANDIITRRELWLCVTKLAADSENVPGSYLATLMWCLTMHSVEWSGGTGTKPSN
ncbi:hypothetical protein Salat_2126800 [Sesamum alatum]|uniref:Uncharacterized protein n=1 Tax=Sesamum alatum TaxID=300844 RepID=A0AAE1Y1G6_9LAMI|nr:hypothetical protein Salat_2126800 [Sesamum alatum]